MQAKVAKRLKHLTNGRKSKQMANLRDLVFTESIGIMNPPKKQGDHLFYDEYVKRTLAAGGTPMSKEEYTLKQRE
jgi:hypothetical protein